jgi:hypothetical protein
MTSYGIALPKGSKYKEMFNRMILEYSYFGELERTRSFWFTGTCSQAMQDAGSNRGTEFGLLQSSSVFFLLAAGIALGVCIHIAKFLVNRYLGDSIMKKMWLYDNMSYNGSTRSNEPKSIDEEDNASSQMPFHVSLFVCLSKTNYFHFNDFRTILFLENKKTIHLKLSKTDSFFFKHVICKCNDEICFLICMIIYASICLRCENGI